MDSSKERFAEEAKEALGQFWFSTQDIVRWNYERLIAKEIETMDEENQKEIIEENLREYIIKKLEELCHPLTNQELEEDDIPLLVEKLSNFVPSKKKETINNFTQYIIYVFNKFQNKEISWTPSDILEPKLEPLENENIGLLVPQNYSELKVFIEIWNYFQNEFIKERTI